MRFHCSHLNILTILNFIELPSTSVIQVSFSALRIASQKCSSVTSQCTRYRFRHKFNILFKYFWAFETLHPIPNYIKLWNQKKNTQRLLLFFSTCPVHPHPAAAFFDLHRYILLKGHTASFNLSSSTPSGSSKCHPTQAGLERSLRQQPWKGTFPWLWRNWLHHRMWIFNHSASPPGQLSPPPRPRQIMPWR